MTAAQGVFATMNSVTINAKSTKIAKQIRSVKKMAAVSLEEIAKLIEIVKQANTALNQNA
jgi:hypothetical protein